MEFVNLMLHHAVQAAIIAQLDHIQIVVNVLDAQLIIVTSVRVGYAQFVLMDII